eukprot:c14410_g1_i1.p1 GENE.c14410_g1_i1~~c14410_g1_i1.p1  ORF type:complete len:403 (+),score=61.07 c14410_g1_i1:149-1357(+)
MFCCYLAGSDPEALVALSQVSRRLRAIIDGPIGEQAWRLLVPTRQPNTPLREQYVGHWRYVNLCRNSVPRVSSTNVGHGGVVALHAPTPRRFFSFEHGVQEFDHRLFVAVTGAPHCQVQCLKELTPANWSIVKRVPLTTSDTARNRWQAAAFDPNGTLLVVAEGTSVIVFDFIDGERFRFSHATSAIPCVHVCSLGRITVAGGYDHHVRAYSLTTGALLTDFEVADTVWSVWADSQSGMIVAGDARGGVTVKRLGTQNDSDLLHLTGHTDMVLSVCATDDGATIVSGSRDTTLKVWDSHSGQLRHTLTGHGALVLAVSTFSNALAASGSRDGTLLIWDIVNGTLVKTVDIGSVVDVKTVKLSSRGVAAGLMDGSLVVVPWTEEQENQNNQEVPEQHTRCAVM